MEDKRDSKDLEIYMGLIQRLDKELERCQQECDDLEKEGKDLDSQYRMLKVDWEEMTDCQKHSLAANKKDANKLTERLESQQQGTEQDSKALRLRYSQDTQELQERVDELKERLDELDTCMMQTAKFEEQKGQLMLQLALVEFLEKQKEENKAVFDRLASESTLEAQKVDNEEAHAIKLATSTIVQKGNAQYSEWSEQFRHLLHESYDVLVLRESLKGQLQNASCEMNKRKTAGNKREARDNPRRERSLKRCQQVEVKLKHYRTTETHKPPKAENLRRELASESEECCHKIAEASQLEADLPRERSKKRELEDVMWRGVTILRQIVMGSEEASDTQSKKQRLEEFVEILKALLTSAEIPDLPTDPSFLLIRYRVGDLGFVPPLTWKCKPAVSTRTKPFPTSQKTSSSADPSPQAPQSDPSPPGPQSDPSPPGPQSEPSPPGPQSNPSPPGPQSDPSPPAPQSDPSPPAPRSDSSSSSPRSDSSSSAPESSSLED